MKSSNEDLVTNCTSVNTKIKTKIGKIEGFTQIVLGKKLITHLGIPFAEPPVGNLRFRKPVPKRPWRGTRKTLKFAKSCSQPTFFTTNIPAANQGEDCLYLNAWIPQGGCKRKHTMVWIVGGGFLTMNVIGSDPKAIAAFTDTIVFTINYRVGPLGFLYFDHNDAPGNMGLLDQSLAIKWIYDNVRRFGGSKHKITLFGQSAGGASVNYHMHSEFTRPYFQKAIIQSGAADTKFGYHSPSVALKTANDFAEQLGCSDINFKCPVIEVAQALPTVNPDNTVYMYSFEYSSLYPPLPEWFGIRHAAENAFVFGAPLIDRVNFSDTDRYISKRMMKYWTTFAKTGNIAKHVFKCYIPFDFKHLNLSVPGEGTIKGFTQIVLGKQIDTFLGIPFAEPPVGVLRFREPVPKIPWRGTRYTQKFAKSCSQPAFFTSNIPAANQGEDCLYLNAWIPQGGCRHKHSMVWIGGGFITGDVVSSDPKVIAAFTNTIVFTISYRIGPLGFLYFDHNDAPGNMGLLDQSLAIKWIYDNVKRFGGSKHKITLFGNSAGGASVNYHMLSEFTRPYFQKAIIQSGAADTKSSFHSPSVALFTANAFATQLGYSINYSDTDRYVSMRMMNYWTSFAKTGY
ncbi:cholinesterase-like [Mytilus galloprovincialis]|uniref:cholinesterase-like n=1 Tax=Mytilus galloprovincialis TaxID=29158 RepID=UPI003F7C4351